MNYFQREYRKDPVGTEKSVRMAFPMARADEFLRMLRGEAELSEEMRSELVDACIDLYNEKKIDKKDYLTAMAGLNDSVVVKAKGKKK